MRRRNPYEAAHQAHDAGWRVINEREVSGYRIYQVMHPSDPGEKAEDRPYIFDNIYLDSRSAWRAVLRYIAKHRAGVP